MARQAENASKALATKMRKLHRTLDQDQDGDLDSHEFAFIAEIPEVKFWLTSLGIETDELSTLFTLIDEDSNGRLTLDELVRRMPRIKGNARSIDVLKIQSQMRDLVEM